MSFGSLFKGMPISLQADISLSLYKKIIDQVKYTLNKIFFHFPTYMYMYITLSCTCTCIHVFTCTLYMYIYVRV